MNLKNSFVFFLKAVGWTVGQVAPVCTRPPGSLWLPGPILGIIRPPSASHFFLLKIDDSIFFVGCRIFSFSSFCIRFSFRGLRPTFNRLATKATLAPLGSVAKFSWRTNGMEWKLSKETFWVNLSWQQNNQNSGINHFYNMKSPIATA